MNKRNTLQRKLILDAVRKLGNHPTADDVYNEIIVGYPTISRATVYRGLRVLHEMGEIKLREIPNSPDRYDHDCSDHYHVRCSICGKIGNVGMKYVDNLLDGVEDSCGFKITGHDVVFYGVCPECLAKSDDSGK